METGTEWLSDLPKVPVHKVGEIQPVLLAPKLEGSAVCCDDILIYKFVFYLIQHLF